MDDDSEPGSRLVLGSGRDYLGCPVPTITGAIDDDWRLGWE